MSYQIVVESFDARFATVLDREHILDYEPGAIHEVPVLYSQLEGFSREYKGNSVHITYRTMHRLLCGWQDPEGAEKLLRSLVDRLPAVLDIRPWPERRIRIVQVLISAGDAGYSTIGGNEHRSCDFKSVVTEVVGLDTGN
jgi:hypothetical protein